MKDTCKWREYRRSSRRPRRSRSTSVRCSRRMRRAAKLPRRRLPTYRSTDLTSTVKAAQTPSANTNQQILAQLIGINTTLMQLLELERAKSAAAAH